MGRQKKNFVELIPCECGKCNEIIPSFNKWGKPIKYKKGHNAKGRTDLIGENNPMFGRTHTPEVRERLRQFNLGKKRSEETKRKQSEIRKGKLVNEKNPSWKGDSVSYKCLHTWLRRHLPKPDFCEICNLVPPNEMSNRTGIYNRDFINWWWLCRPCHKKFDFIVERNLIPFTKKNHQPS